MRRRNFIKLATGMLALGTANFLGHDGEAETPKPYQRVKLVNDQGHAIKTATLREDEGYLFFYPYRSTPCFLLKLGAGQGGVGRAGSVVAYAAICTHQVTRPSPRKSFINYRPKGDGAGDASGRITCCLHGSVFDPAQGGKVVGGPAPLPLTTIRLDYDEENDELYAVGTLGGDVYKAYFKAYRKELRQEFGAALVRQESSGEAVVMRFSDYAKRQFFC